MADEIVCGSLPVAEVEVESGLEQAGGDDVTALEHQLWFSTHEESGDLEQGPGGGDAVGHLPRIAQGLHELSIGQRVGSSEVDWAGDVFMLDEEVDGAGKVSLVNPGDELAAIALGSTEANADEVEQDGEGASGNRAEDNGAAQSDFARAWRGDGEEECFPVLGDADGKIPGLGRVPVL